MKIKWCWRCQMNVPMLNEEEFAEANKLYGLAFRAPIGNSKIEVRFNKLLNFYNKLTGWNETVPNAIMHHRISQYGPDCPNCSKPLRTKKARYCAACGFGIEEVRDQSTKPLLERKRDLFDNT